MLSLSKKCFYKRVPFSEFHNFWDTLYLQCQMRPKLSCAITRRVQGKSQDQYGREMGWYVCPSLAIYRLFYHALTPYLLMTPLLPKIHTRCLEQQQYWSLCSYFYQYDGISQQGYDFLSYQCAMTSQMFQLFLTKKVKCPFYFFGSKQVSAFFCEISLLLISLRTCIMLGNVFRIFWLTIANKMVHKRHTYMNKTKWA